jgi:hypothetical protein
MDSPWWGCFQIECLESLELSNKWMNRRKKVVRHPKLLKLPATAKSRRNGPHFVVLGMEYLQARVVLQAIWKHLRIVNSCWKEVEFWRIGQLTPREEMANF